MQAEAGFCYLTGEPEGPPARFGLSMVDFMAGTQLAVGLLAALLDAQRSGTGRDIDVDLLSAAVHQTTYPALWYLNEGDVTMRVRRSAHPSATPSQLFRAADGWMFVMCQLPKFWDVLIEKLGRPDLAADPRFASEAARLENRQVLSDLLDDVFGQQPVAHWMALLQGAMPAAPVHALDAAMDNPWLETIGMIDTVDHPDRQGLRVLASAIKVDGQRLPNRAGPLLGADSDDVLAELGYTAGEIARLREAGTV